jgi:hypothetical protein
MKFYILIFVFIFLVFSESKTQTNDYTVELARQFSKDIFEGNGINYLQPVVRVINATSNSRFYSTTSIPYKSEKPYLRFGIHTMTGIVPEDFKSYQPYMPNEKFDMNKLVSISGIGLTDIPNLPNMSWEEIQQKMDVAAVIHYFFLNMMYMGIYDDNGNPLANPLIKVPGKASTALGDFNTAFQMPRENMKTLAEQHPLYGLLPEQFRDTLDSVLGLFPEEFNLPAGNNLNTIFAFVPQFELGSWYGTELMVRFIPKVNMGETVGKFSFWGIGVKHNLSSYLEEIPFDLALQMVYQRTSLENTVGVTNAKLKADAGFFNVNLSATKKLSDNFHIFTAVAYETVEIESQYTYTLPIVVQWELGLIERNQFKPTPGFPGDQNPQKAKMMSDDYHHKWSFGAAYDFNRFNVIADFSISKFNIFSLGLNYKIF